MTLSTDDANVPVRDRARSQLRECEALIRQLFDASDALLGGRERAPTTAERRSGAAEKASQPVQIMKKLIERQRALRKLIEEVVEHQRLHAIIEELRAANAAEDEKIAQLGANLRQAESIIQDVLDEAKPRLGALHRANKRPVDVDEVISYGSKISASLSAPSGWDPSQPLGNHLPPAPPEEMMRAGRLAALALADGENGVAPTEKPNPKPETAAGQANTLQPQTQPTPQAEAEGNDPVAI